MRVATFPGSQSLTSVNVLSKDRQEMEGHGVALS
jgi:hypothetical protein